MKVFMQETMGMTGDMAMSGSMDMRDDLGVDGTIDTSLKTDDRPSPLSQVVVRSDSGNGGRMASVSADGLLLNRNIGGFGSMGKTRWPCSWQTRKAVRHRGIFQNRRLPSAPISPP